ncbi:unnamed protein product [Rotaria sp. Silwood1]|nr:unnamed protein product [Rotaria sp. Silwood1]
MSSSNALTLFDRSRLSTVYPLGATTNTGLGYQQTILAQDGEGNSYIKSTNVQTVAGPSRDTGISVQIRNTYPARYNFAVKQYRANADANNPKKKEMRGGHFLLYRSVIVLAWLIALGAGGISSILKPLIENSSKWKPFLALNIFICLFYIIISIYNIVIFKRNGSLFNRRMIHDNSISKINMYVTIPIHTFVTQTQALASEQEDVVAGLQNVQNQVNEIQVMYYKEYYVRTYTYFPRSIIKHIIFFVIAMAEGIVLTIMI